MSKPKISLIGARGAVVDINRDGESVQMRAAISSDEPVPILPGVTEVLVHTEDAIDMSRAARGLPLTVGHSEMEMVNPNLPVGRVGNLSIVDGRLRGDLSFDTDARSEEVRGKVERGMAPDLSVNYKRLDWSGPDDSGRVTVSRWMPLAVSVVSVPADASVGVGRSLDTEADMPEEKANEAGNASIVERVRQRTQAGFGDGARAENERINEIQSVADMLARSQPHMSDEMRALAEEARRDQAISADAFRSSALELFGLGSKPLTPAGVERSDGARALRSPGDARAPLIEAGRDSKEGFARGLADALFERAGGKVTPEQMEGNEYRGWSLMDGARESLELAGGSCRGMTNEQIARQAFRQGLGARAISPGTANYVTADFPAITENVITKLLTQGYSEAPITWNRWASSREVPDFKPFTIPRMSATDDLPIVAENAAYTNLTRVDGKETSELVKHGGVFSLSLEAVYNDDMSAFQDQAAAMGAAAARTVDKKAYAVMTVNPGAGPVQGIVMGDTNQLFSAAHSNVGANALILDGVVATRTAMARQTDDNGEEYYSMLRYLLVPEELRDAAENLAGSEYLPWTDASPGAQRINTIRSTFEVVATTRLTDVNDWIAADGQNTVEVAFLAGNRNPALMREEGWDTDALHWKIRHPSVAYAKNWRGLYLNVNA